MRASSLLALFLAQCPFLWAVGMWLVVHSGLYPHSLMIRLHSRVSKVANGYKKAIRPSLQR